jgi:basic membrane lipoprotein Med (substrate-binding protein (PBP1-ABC) superfamily)
MRRQSTAVNIKINQMSEFSDNGFKAGIKYLNKQLVILLNLEKILAKK